MTQQGFTITSIPEQQAQPAQGGFVITSVPQGQVQQRPLGEGLSPEQQARLAQIQAQTQAEQERLLEESKPGVRETLLIGTGKGLTDVGRFFQKKLAGLVAGEEAVQSIQQQQAAEQQAFEVLKEQRPVAARVGEFAGETVATLPAGGLVGGLARNVTARVAAPIAGTTAGRLAPVIAGGAGEGAAVAAQLEENVGTGAGIGAATEAFLPPVLRAAGRAFRRLTGRAATTNLVGEAGELTAEGIEELRRAGIDPELFTDELGRSIQEGFDPTVDLAVQARQAQLAEFAPGVEAKPSTLTQDFATQSAEEQLIASGTPAGRAFQAAEQQVQEGLQEGAKARLLGDIETDLQFKFDTISNDVNLELAGQAVKDAVDGTRTAQRQAVTDLYQAARDLAGAGQKIPTNNIAQQFVDSSFELAPTDKVSKAVGRALKEFGVLEGTELAAETGFKLPAGRSIQELTLDNAELLRQRLNKIKPTEPTDIKFLVEVKNQLDNQVNEIIDLIPEDAASAQAFKEAREAASKFKTTFEDGDFVERLVSLKRGSSTVELVPPEKVLNQVLSKDINQVQKLKGILLDKPTKATKQAWNDIQFTTIDEVLRRSIAKDSLGNPQLSGRRLNSALQSIGDQRLKLILGDAKFNQLKRFQQVLSDQTVPLVRGANPSGTAGQVNPILGRISDLLKGAGDLQTGGLVTAAAKSREQRKAIADAAAEIAKSTGQTKAARNAQFEQQLLDYLSELQVPAAVAASDDE